MTSYFDSVILHSYFVENKKNFRDAGPSTIYQLMKHILDCFFKCAPWENTFWTTTGILWFLKSFLLDQNVPRNSVMVIDLKAVRVSRFQTVTSWVKHYDGLKSARKRQWSYFNEKKKKEFCHTGLTESIVTITSLLYVLTFFSSCNKMSTDL